MDRNPCFLVILFLSFLPLSFGAQEQDVTKPLAGAPKAEVLQKWCGDVKRSTDQFKWNIEPCKAIPWVVGGSSIEERPLVYAEFGDPKAENTTLVLSMVHGDEVTPLYLGLQL